MKNNLCGTVHPYCRCIYCGLQLCRDCRDKLVDKAYAWSVQDAHAKSSKCGGDIADLMQFLANGEWEI